MLYAKENCPICGYGQVGFRVCSDQKNIVLMCDECNTVWLDPNKVDAKYSLYPAPPEFTVPTLECSIKKPASRWATRQEVLEKGWAIHIAGEVEALDEV